MGMVEAIAILGIGALVGGAVGLIIGLIFSLNIKQTALSGMGVGTFIPFVFYIAKLLLI